MGYVAGLLAALIAALFAHLEGVFLSVQRDRKARELENAKNALAQVDKALAIKEKLDAADAGTVERMRAWYAAAFKRDRM